MTGARSSISGCCLAWSRTTSVQPGEPWLAEGPFWKSTAGTGFPVRSQLTPRDGPSTRRDLYAAIRVVRLSADARICRIEDVASLAGSATVQPILTALPLPLSFRVGGYMASQRRLRRSRKPSPQKKDAVRQDQPPSRSSEHRSLGSFASRAWWAGITGIVALTGLGFALWPALRPSNHSSTSLTPSLHIAATWPVSPGYNAATSVAIFSGGPDPAAIQPPRKWMSELCSRGQGAPLEAVGLT